MSPPLIHWRNAENTLKLWIAFDFNVQCILSTVNHSEEFSLHSITRAYAPLSNCQNSCYDKRNKCVLSSTELGTWQIDGSIYWLQSFSEVTFSVQIRKEDRIVKLWKKRCLFYLSAACSMDSKPFFVVVMV